MEIVDLGAQPENLLQAAAAMLVEDFDAPAGWPDLSLAHQEVADILEHGFARALLDSGSVLGWIGGLPEYGGVFGNCIQSLYKEVIDGKG